MIPKVTSHVFPIIEKSLHRESIINLVGDSTVTQITKYFSRNSRNPIGEEFRVLKESRDLNIFSKRYGNGSRVEIFESPNGKIRILKNSDGDIIYIKDENGKILTEQNKIKTIYENKKAEFNRVIQNFFNFD